MKPKQTVMLRLRRQQLAWLVAYWLALNGCGEKQPSAVFEANANLAAPPHSKLTDVSFRQVRINDKFWNPRLETNHKKTLEAVYRKNTESGAIQNLAIVAGKAKGQHRGPFWADSDVYKWLEGASYTLALTPDPELEAKVDEVIGLIARAQQKDGYLDTYIQLANPQAKWANLAFFHEDFNAGHFFEAAVAHYESTGKRTLLDVAIRNADLWVSVFGPGKRDGIPGHEGIELALVRLYRATNEKRYLQLAQFFLDGRGQKPSFFEQEYERLDPSRTANFLGQVRTIRHWQDRMFRKDPNKFDTSYSQDHLPVRQQTEVVGHAVRAMYLFSGMADVAYETGDQFCYVNPLASSGKAKRHDWFSVPCCPTNVVRILPSLGHYIYSQSEDGLWVNLYIQSDVTTKLSNGAEIKLSQAGNYPWDGQIRLKVEVSTPREFSLSLRIPSWTKGVTAKLNSRPIPLSESSGYARVRQHWTNADEIELNIPIETDRLEAHPQVVEDRGKVALRRRPLIYCLEQPDHSVDVERIVLSRSAKLESHFELQWLNGVTVITGQGTHISVAGWENQLYRPLAPAQPQAISIKAIPYYAWGNRRLEKFVVWVPSVQ